jgi:site-specific DNA-cytosine methylase
VQDVDDKMVREWGRAGGGPPCQGVSGLNSERKGALRDERSKLFTHVERILALVRQHFPWSQVHGLMESVASMDTSDRKVMSESFGRDP